MGMKGIKTKWNLNFLHEKFVTSTRGSKIPFICGHHLCTTPSDRMEIKKHSDDCDRVDIHVGSKEKDIKKSCDKNWMWNVECTQ